MAITWGSTALKVRVGTWRPGIPSVTTNESPLLPNPENLSAVASVLQDGPTLRKKVKGRLYVTSMTAYNSFANDYISRTQRTLDDDDTINATYVIDNIGEPEYEQDNVIFFDITFVEV